MAKRFLSIILAAVLTVGMVPMPARAAAPEGLCAHHTEHTAECGYVPAVAEVPCTHVHDDACGYVPAVAGTPCSYLTQGCPDCAGEQKGTEPTEEPPEPSGEPAEPSPGCTCESDDPVLHAPFCALYVRTYEPCLCQSACGEENGNPFCEACYFGGVDACLGGYDRGAPYVTAGAFTLESSEALIENTDYTYSDGVLTILSGKAIILSTDSTTTDTVVIADGITANLTLAGVSIDVSGISDACALKVAGTAILNLTLAADSTNTLKSGSKAAGLEVSQGATLTVGGTGALEATGGSNTAGIGGHGWVSGSTANYGGTITINSGTITATGGSSGAGIGSDTTSSGGTIRISGGTVTATGGGNHAGIGGNNSSIIISGGTVTATGGADYVSFGGAGIGGNNSSITISGGTVTANGGNISAGISGTSITLGDTSHVYATGSTAVDGEITGADGAYWYCGNGEGFQQGPISPESSTTVEFEYIGPGHLTYTQDVSGVFHTISCGEACPNRQIAIKEEVCSGGTATCSAKAVCTKCRGSYGELGEHDLSYNQAGNTVSCQAGCGGTVTVSAEGKVYDGSAAAISVIKTGFEDMDTTYTLRKDSAPFTGEPVDAGNYTVSIESLGVGTSFEIERRPVTVTADAVSKELGKDDPALTYNAEGLVTGDALTGTLSRASGENVGTYAISQGTLTNENNPNYNIEFVSRDFTINPTDNYNEKVSKKQDVIREVGAFEEPSYSGIHGEKVAGNLSYIYRGASYTYEELVEVLKAMPFGALLQVDYTFSPTDSNYTGNRTGAMEIIVYTVRFKVNGETATAENAIVRTGTPVYGDTLSDRITISGALTAELLRETDANPHNFSFSHKPGDPLPVGTHTIQILYSGTILGVEYKNVTVCEFTVTVNKADSAVTKAPEAISGLKFKEENGNEVQQALVTAGEATGGTMVYRIGSDGEWSQDIPTAGQVRDYTVYYKVLGDSNHNDSAEGQVNVSIVKADAPTVTIPVQEHFYTIPTAENRIDIKSLLPKLCGIINEESEVTGTTGDFIENAAFNNGVLSYDTKTGTLGATGTITVKIVMRNYEDVTVTVNVELIDLNPVSNSGTDDEIKYDGSTYDVAQMFSKDTNAGEASYEISGGSGAGELNGSVLTITKAGTIQIKLTTAATIAYAAGEATATLTVKKADGAGSVTMDDWTYGETAKTPTTENGTGTAIFLYTGSGYSSANVPTDAGTYTVTATFVENDLYEAATARDTFVIAQRELTPSITGSVSKPYDGRTTVPAGLSIALDGIIASDDVSATARYAYESADVGTTQINATGITLSGTDEGNYKLTATTVSADVGQITMADPTYTVPTGLTATYGDTLAKVTLPKGFTWEDAPTTPVGNAGTRTFKVTFTPDDVVNYNVVTDIEVSVEVAKAVLTITADSKAIYIGEELPELTYTVSGLVPDETLADEPDLTTDADKTKPGSYTITPADANAGDNYSITYVNGTLTVMDKDTEVETKVEKTELTTVPNGLKNTRYNTVAAIKQELTSRIVAASTGFSGEDMAHYDVTLQFSLDGGKTWIHATAENFPTEGITVTLPYPAGTNAEDYDFMVSHMFTVTSQRLGTTAGEVELPTVTETASGIRVTLKGLSPVTVAWKVTEFDVNIAGTTNGTVTTNVSKAASGTEIAITVTPNSGYKMGTITVKDADGNSQAVSTDNKGKYYFTMPKADVTVTVTFNKVGIFKADPTNPKTGDDSWGMLWSGTLWMSSACLIAVLLEQKRKRIR